jgi:oxygen-dependent protoporphyrinogen oxidase
MQPDRTARKHVAIIGGGISGLATAFTLQEWARGDGCSLTYTLFESAPVLGGKILTDREKGFVIEGGPDSFLGQKPWAVQMAQRLGLENELIGTNPDHKKLYVINHGQLTPMPDGVQFIIPTRLMPFITSPLISWPGKLRMGMDFIIPRRRTNGDESVGDFIRRRLGSEALDKIAEPLMSGIHVSDPERQSLLGTFPRFRALEQQYGSLIGGMLAQKRLSHPNGNGAKPANPSWKNSAFVTLRGGMDRLVQGLEAALTDGKVMAGVTVSGVEPAHAGGYHIRTTGGEQMMADAVVLATPAFVSAELIAPFAPELSVLLRKIRYVSTATVSLAFLRSEVGNLLDGVGFIVPRKEHRKISACTVSSTKFAHRAPEDQVLIRCFVGGPGHEESVTRSDAEIITDARSELAALLGVRAEPRFARVYRWIKGNAQYDVGHLERVRQMQQMCTASPGLFLTGSAYEGVGVPDCIHQGQQTAEKVFAFLQGNPIE